MWARIDLKNVSKAAQGCSNGTPYTFFCKRIAISEFWICCSDALQSKLRPTTKAGTTKARPGTTRARPTTAAAAPRRRRSPRTRGRRRSTRRSSASRPASSRCWPAASATWPRRSARASRSSRRSPRRTRCATTSRRPEDASGPARCRSARAPSHPFPSD